MLDFNSSYGDCPNFSMGDYLTFKFVPEQSRQFDRQLYESKWFDYRFMSPIEATAEFIAAYERVGRRIYARDIDYERAEHIKFMSAEEYLNILDDQAGLMSEAKGVAQVKKVEKSIDRAKKNFAGHWRARSVADAIGMPYDAFIDSMMSYRMAWEGSVVWRKSNGDAKPRKPTIAQPTQLYNESDVNKTIERWAEMQVSRIWYAEHHAYMPENWRAAPAQIDYTSYLLERARGAHFDKTVIGMLNNDKIAPQGVRHVLGDVEYQRLISLSH